jgi:hypothetical protein
MFREKAKEHFKTSKLGNEFVVNKGHHPQKGTPKAKVSKQTLTDATQSIADEANNASLVTPKAQKKIERQTKKFARKYVKDATKIAKIAFGDNVEISLDPSSYKEQRGASGLYDYRYRSMNGTASIQVDDKSVEVDVTYTTKRAWRGIISLGDTNTVAYGYKKERVWNQNDLKRHL